MGSAIAHRLHDRRQLRREERGRPRPITSILGDPGVTACTISGNSAANVGGGLANADQCTMTLTDTIVAGNVVGEGEASDVGYAFGAGVTGTYNLIGPGGSGGIVGGRGGNIVLTDVDGLDLGPLADNGGPTQTLALLPGSAAIGAGTAVAGVTTDQRGMPLDSPPRHRRLPGRHARRGLDRPGHTQPAQHTRLLGDGHARQASGLGRDRRRGPLPHRRRRAEPDQRECHRHARLRLDLPRRRPRRPHDRRGFLHADRQRRRHRQTPPGIRGPARSRPRG